jgi:hypothetical protein
MIPSVREGIIRVKSYQMVNAAALSGGIRREAVKDQRTEVMALRFCAQASCVEAGSIGRDLP